MAEGGRLGVHGTLALALTGLSFTVAALMMPVVTLAKFGNEHRFMLLDGFRGLATQGFGLVGAAVIMGGVVTPLGLLLLLISVQLTDHREKFHRANQRLRRLAEAVQYWTMPEVQVLGVLVAFFKLNAVVDTTPEPGLYVYGVASWFTLLAWRSFKLTPRRRPSLPLSPAPAHLSP